MKQNILHTNNKSGFILPKNYLEEFEDVVIAQSKLNDIKEYNFKLPEGYLENLDANIISKVKPKTKSSKLIKITFSKQIVYISSTAAAILLMFNLSIFESKETFESLDIQTVENYIYSENISTYEIASLLTEDDLKEENFIDYNLSNENIENYILDHIDIQTIILE